MKLVRNSWLALMLVLTVNLGHTQLVGKGREPFISGTAQVCYKNQRSGSPNKNLSVVMLMQYCRCTAVYVADLLNNALANEIENGIQKLNPAFGEMAAKYCRINYGKY